MCRCVREEDMRCIIGTICQHIETVSSSIRIDDLTVHQEATRTLYPTGEHKANLYNFEADS